MKLFKTIVAIVSVCLGIFFIWVGGSDIQLGTGLILITNGLLHIR